MEKILDRPVLAGNGPSKPKGDRIEMIVGMSTLC